MSSEIISNGNFPPQGDNMMKADYRLTADQMDDKRKQNIAYEYLCHLEEAKVWIQACINEELPPTTELEEGLRNGVFLAQLGHFLSPQTVPLKKIYDRDQTRYQGRGLHFRHTDNINHWFSAMDKIGLPKIFYPETTDIYDRKNMPRVIYCLHALSLYCFKLGMAPQIQDLYGKVQFTDEEISAMRLELEKYGIQMPAFGKIGGILANELSVDDAALHAAIIAINEAVDRDNATETMAALQNPSAMLVNLDHEAEEQYQTLLSDAKQTKAEIAKNKSMDLDGTYEYDVYDELLTQAEIQGNINKVNVARALDKLCAGLLENDVETVMQILRSPALSLKGIQEDNRNLYMKALQETYRNKLQSTDEDDCILDRDEIQNAINEANLEADAEYQKLLCVKSINSAVDSDDPAALLQALQNPKAQLPSVHQYGLMLYFEEFTSMKREKEADLDYDEIYTALNVMSAVVGINQAVEVGNSECTFMALSTENAFITNLDEDNMDRYQKQLFLSLSEKSQAQCKLLTHYEISSIVDQVNEQVDVEHKRIEALRNINEAIRQGDPQLTLDTLKHPDALLENVCEDQAYRYHILLNRAIQKKEEEYKDEDATLWVNEIQELVDRANQDAQDGVALSSAVIAANEKIEEGNDQNLFECLSSNDLGLHSVIQDCAQMYVTKLQEFKSEKSSKGDVGSGWIMNRLPDNSKFFYNVYNSSYVWARTENMVKDSQYLTRDEIQSTVAEVTASHDRELMFQSNERFVIRIQSCVRGYLVWKAFKERLSFMQEQLPAIVKIQATWKGFKQRSKYNDRLDFLSKHTDVATKLQSVIRMWLVNKEYRKRLKYFREHEDSVIKIQAFVRSNKAKHDYNALMHEENPPLSVVQRFVHLLDASDVDYAEEIELQKLRQQVVTEIKSTKDLERDLDTMDIKIGLLIKNRISIHDVVTHDKKLSKHKEISFHQPKGLKALSKEAHDRLEAYQYLFYLLQTNPTYLAKLIFEMPQMRTTKFMESVIYSLFNYGSNQREEYLLLRLFQTALEEEVGSKVEKMSDFITGNPLVVKMIVGYNRNQRGQNSLREMLNPVVLEVIEDKNIRINTNPVDIYKAWINQTETTTGKTSTLPYDVSVEQALEHNEVQQQLKKSIAVLQEVTDKFLTAILNSLDKIPYCMRYMAKVLKNVLVKKFPGALEKDILKIVGNVLYYRYINSAIVAPDCFDIINVEADKPLTNDQRLNLGSVAKILQCAASSRGFGGESNYLASMNPYIREAHEKFKNYCLQACDVPEPEEKFNMDQYTDVVTMTKPVIYISVSEICDTHELLLDHQDQIAPEPNDPLHELLEDLGDVPSVDELLGVDLPEDPQLHDHFLSQLGTTEITLTLNNKFEVPEDEQTDIQQLLIKTKRLVVDVIACQPGENLTQILETPATEEQEEMHQTLVKKRDIRDRKMVKGHGTKLVRNQSLLGDNRLPIESIKAKIKKNMQNLELSEIVSRKNKYQDIVNMIAQDIRNQRKYRNSRKQDLLKTKSILKSLAAKRSFYESQIDYYSRYVKTCMENLQNTKANNRRSKGLFKKTDKKLESVKYSGAKLHDKGIILDVEGLPPNQLKNVMFEIFETNDPGVFDVNARFMGVEMDKVELVFETLLQLQYEGVAVMEMFGKAKINVNLLIFLLNKKFYGRHGK